MKYIIVSIVGLSMFGCASNLVKSEEMKGVKKVAIVGFDLQQQRSVSGMDLLSIAAKVPVKNGASPALGAESTQAELAYKDFAANLNGKTGWSVMKIEDLRKNAAYTAFFKSKTEGLQNRPIINDRIDLLRPAGVVDNFAIMITEKEKLAQLAKDLGVDAVVTSTTTIDLNSNGVFAAVTGNGEYKPSGKTTMLVKNAAAGENIISLSAQGPKVEQGEKNIVGMSNEENLNKLALEATRLSVQNVMKEIPSVF
ncbi:MAG: hypothetical protein V4736_05570 [Bdellovibrionota bacterium]